jgi:hypothetical protein
MVISIVVIDGDRCYNEFGARRVVTIVVLADSGKRIVTTQLHLLQNIESIHMKV